MDKHLIGKWYREEEWGETLNIFDETPPRMKMSFSTYGHFNVEPNCVYEDGDELCFETNDEQNRMMYRVHYEAGQLRGTYTQFGKKTPVVYQKQSDVPEDGAYQYVRPTYYLPGTEKPRLEVLRENSDYRPSDRLIPSSIYKLNGRVPKILEKYGFASYFEGLPADSDAIAFAALDFVCDHFGHDGCNGMGKRATIKGQIKFCEAHGGKVNCRGLAIMLSSILRLKGIQARHITCMPYEEPFTDCHVVVDCLLPSGSRVMLDPTSHLYYTDKQGEFVSLRHLREMLIAGEELFPCEKASYNKGSFDAEDNRYYMIKNTFRFFRGYTFADGVDEHLIDLIPPKYVDKQVKGRRYTTDDNDFWKM